MKRIHILGRKNHGKTTLIVELVRELTERGLCIGTIKHTHHEHELDLPGKDSYRHREAGAAVAGILSRSMNAVFWPPQEKNYSKSDDRYEGFGPFFDHCHLVLVEGDSRTSADRIEVWRKQLGSQPLAYADRSIHAVVSNDPMPDSSIRIWPREDIGFIADQLLALATDRD